MAADLGRAGADVRARRVDRGGDDSVSGHVYKVTIALPKSQFMTVRVRAADRDQAKARALNQAHADGYKHVAVTICRKDSKPSVFGDWPAPTNGGKPA